MKKGSLTIVGTGIRTVGQLTTEALAHIRGADKVLYVLSEAVAENVVRRLNPGGAESLEHLYRDGKPRLDTYNEMVDRICEHVYAGHVTVAAFYGHPGVFAYPSHAALRRLREQGYEAQMLPGISAEDCLFADLGIDPGTYGCQSYEATSLVVRRTKIDPTSVLILWQIGVFGHYVYRSDNYDLGGLHFLVDYLTADYPADHEVCLYEASIFPGCQPRMEWIPLGDLAKAQLNPATTLFIPPARLPTLDTELLGRLGLDLSEGSAHRQAAATNPVEGPTQ